MHVVICSYAVHFACLIIHGLVINSIGEENKFWSCLYCIFLQPSFTS